MHKNKLLVVTIIKSLHKLLLVLLALVLLPACQSLSLLQNKTNPSVGVRHEFSLIDKQSVFGQLGELKIASDDSLPLIARYFGLGFDEIAIANPGIDPWLPESGHIVNLPSRFILPDAPRKGLILNLDAKRLFYFPKNKKHKVITFPIGIGRKDWNTPTGSTKIISKKEHPRWFVPKSIRLEHAKKGDPLPKVVAAGPGNPLGDYAIRLDIPGYLIHGTNKPYGVGMAVSHGCVRLYPEDIELLFKEVKTKTPVRLLHQPFLIGWENEELFIQVYPPLLTNKKLNRKQLASFKKKLKRIERKSNRNIAWHKVETAITLSNGIPISIFTDSIVDEQVIKFSHPLNLEDDITPTPLFDDSWRIKVTTFPDKYSAKRFAVMLNHQGPIIPAHVISGTSEFIVVAGSFNSEKKAKKIMTRLGIDFELDAKLIEPGKNIPDEQQYFSFFSNIESFFD